VQEIDRAVAVLTTHFEMLKVAGEAEQKAWQTLKSDIAQHAGCSAKGSISKLFNRWLLTACKTEAECNAVKGFCAWVTEHSLDASYKE
jgi:hypothetical protein